MLRGDPEGKRLLHLAAPRSEHAEFAGARELHQCVQQPRFADAGRALDEQHATGRARRVRDDRGDRRKFSVALDELDPMQP